MFRALMDQHPQTVSRPEDVNRALGRRSNTVTRGGLGEPQ